MSTRTGAPASAGALGVCALLVFAALGSPAPLAAQENPEPQTVTPPPAGAEPEGGQATVPPGLTPVEPIDQDEEAQQKPEEPGYTALQIETGAGRDDGLRSRDQGSTLFDVPTKQTLYLARASLLVYRHPSDRSSFTFGYRPEIERFGGSGGTQLVNHSAGLLLEEKPTERSRFVVGGRFLDGQDPSRFLSDVFVVIPRTDYRQGQGYATYEYLWRRTTASVSAGYLMTRIDPVESLLVDGVDQRDWIGALGIQHDLTRRLSVNASYSYDSPQGRSLVFDGTPTTPTTPITPMPSPATGDTAANGFALDPLQSFVVGAVLKPTDTLSLDGSAGITETTGASSWIGSFGIEGTRRDNRISLRYDRSLASFTNGFGAAGAGAATGAGQGTTPGLGGALLADTVSDSVTLGFGVRLAERTEWTGEARTARTDLRTHERLDALVLGSRLLVGFTERLGVFGEIDYFDQSRTQLTPSFYRLRYAAGLVFGLGGPPTTTALVTERQRLGGVLPNGGGDFQ